MDKKFTVAETSLPGLLLITPRVLLDSRGFYIEVWNEADFAEFGIKDNFIQDYYTRSAKNVLRGLHCQWPPKATAKIVRCGTGEVWDVVVDLRPSSPTFKKWQSFILSAENRNALYIPPGFVHGFYATSDIAETFYKVTTYFDKDLDGGIRWNDPEIGIEWPVKDPILSDKDKNLPFLKDAMGKLSW